MAYEGPLGLRNQDHLQEDRRREGLHAHRIRSSYTLLQTHRASSSPSEAQRSLEDSQPDIHSYSRKGSLSSLACLTYGLVGNQHVLLGRGLHRSLLLRNFKATSVSCLIIATVCSVLRILRGTPNYGRAITVEMWIPFSLTIIYTGGAPLRKSQQHS